MEKCQSVAFSCLSGSLNCVDRRLCFQEVGNRHLFPGAAIWQPFFSGNKIKTNMSECSSSSTDADQPGEKLDLSVSGLMVFLYASGKKGVCGLWCVCVSSCLCVYMYFCARCEHSTAEFCTCKYSWNHLSAFKGDVAMALQAVGWPNVGSIKQHRTKKLQG